MEKNLISNASRLVPLAILKRYLLHTFNMHSGKTNNPSKRLFLKLKSGLNDLDALNMSHSNEYTLLSYNQHTHCTIFY